MHYFSRKAIKEILSYVVFSLIRTTLLLTTRTRPTLSTVSLDILISEVSYVAEYILT